ncbi:Nuclear ubiquitous casein and cyclin-dependent kinases substrate [Fukomys damarensis]|uniref:Nuclear ubiquitous casein and cyclin-dependent kinases substrate n=1 Tax=Fukomys damarensis TaxID=885580 RepID=A0A091CNN3_FUKDA|nr:Nuclear ubiquitous casein and cyclin-dependent kinases substrate [Fukomys damarensis]
MGSRDHLFKVLVVGDAAVGKTSLVQRYSQDSFRKHYKSTVGVDFALKVLRWSDSEMVRLQLWDIAGQERFTSMTRLYYRDASACVIMFDVTNAATFSNSQRWKQDLDSKLTLPSGEPVPCLLLANKCDLSPWAVSRDQIDRFSKENGFTGWTETSVKENKNINEAMRNRKVVDYSQFQESDDADEDYGRDSGPPTKKIRSSREAKNKRRSGKNSQEDSEDSEEKDVKTKKDDSHSAEDSEDEKDDHKNVRQQRQAASKAASKQREMLMEDVGSEEEQEEEDEAPFQEKDSGSDEDFLMEDDDDSDYGSSKKKNKKMVKKSKPERKEKKMPRPRLKATVMPSPVKGKGKVGRPTASKASKEKTPSPKEEDEEPESPPEKKALASPPPEKSGDEGSEDEAQSGED